MAKPLRVRLPGLLTHSDMYYENHPIFSFKSRSQLDRYMIWLLGITCEHERYTKIRNAKRIAEAFSK